MYTLVHVDRSTTYITCTVVTVREKESTATLLIGIHALRTTMHSAVHLQRCTTGTGPQPPVLERPNANCYMLGFCYFIFVHLAQELKLLSRYSLLIK